MKFTINFALACILTASEAVSIDSTVRVERELNQVERKSKPRLAENENGFIWIAATKGKLAESEIISNQATSSTSAATTQNVVTEQQPPCSNPERNDQIASFFSFQEESEIEAFF